jgi:hypothetical protein
MRRSTLIVISFLLSSMTLIGVVHANPYGSFKRIEITTPEELARLPRVEQFEFAKRCLAIWSLELANAARNPSEYYSDDRKVIDYFAARYSNIAVDLSEELGIAKTELVNSVTDYQKWYNDNGRIRMRALDIDIDLDAMVDRSTCNKLF